MNLCIENVLVPTDFSDATETALEYAKLLAVQFNATLHLLHVIPLPMGTRRPTTPWISVENEVRLQLQLAEQHLEQVIDAEWSEQHRVVRHSVIGFEVEEITKYAKIHRIDLIVVGTHGRKGLSHLLLGSVAEKVVRMATCPVLSVHPEGQNAVLQEIASSKNGLQQ